MPVRLLNYVAELFKIYLEPEKRKMYSSSLIQIPAPEFYTVVINYLTISTIKYCMDVKLYN